MRPARSIPQDRAGAFSAGPLAGRAGGVFHFWSWTASPWIFARRDLRPAPVLIAGTASAFPGNDAGQPRPGPRSFALIYGAAIAVLDRAHGRHRAPGAHPGSFAPIYRTAAAVLILHPNCIQPIDRPDSYAWSEDRLAKALVCPDCLDA